MRSPAVLFKRGSRYPTDSFVNNAFKLENLFVLLVLVFGTLFAVLVPPNQVPDEHAHIARVYGTLEGKVVNNNMHLPDQLRFFVIKYYRVDLQKTNIPVADYFKEFSIKSGGRAMEADTAAPYSPILYVPQLIGVSLGMLFRLGDLATFVLGKLFSLLVYSGLGYVLLKKTPVAQRSIFIVLMMPMSVFLAASFSADTVQNLLSLLYLNMVVVGLSSQTRVSKKEFAMFLGGGVLLSLSKPLGLLIVLLSLAIPVTRFKNRQEKMIFVLSQLGLGLIFAFLWSRLSTPAENTVVYAFDYIKPKVQLMHIFLNPISYIKVIFATLSQSLEDWYYGFVGKFAWNSMRMPEFVYILFPIAMSIALLIDRKQSLRMTKEQRYIFLGVFVLYVVAVITSMYLFWSPVGNPISIGAQGRYFISVIPILLYLFLSVTRQRNLPWERAAQMMMVSLVSLMLFFATQTIYLRYYVPCGKFFYDINGTCRLPVDLPPEEPVGEITKPVTQTFTAQCDDITGVDLYFATYARRNTGFLNVSLRDETSNTLVFDEKINVAKLKDNDWQSFSFPKIQNVNGNHFVLTLSPLGSTPGNAVSVWATASDLYAKGELSGAQSNGDLVFRYVCRYGIVHEIRSINNR